MTSYLPPQSLPLNVWLTQVRPPSQADFPHPHNRSLYPWRPTWDVPLHLWFLSVQWQWWQSFCLDLHSFQFQNFILHKNISSVASQKQYDLYLSSQCWIVFFPPPQRPRLCFLRPVCPLHFPVHHARNWCRMHVNWRKYIFNKSIINSE